MAAIILPAYNEATVIAAALESLLAQVAPDDEIIVSCNGCSDGTAQIARRYEPRVTVIETQTASKTVALNLADRQAKSFPRIYMDADVRLEEGALARLKEALNSGRWPALSTNVRMDLADATWPVRAYYDVWLSLPYCRSGMIGAGLYALTEAGRGRFGDFPVVIADDGYVRALFTEDERGSAADAYSIVKAPATLHWLLKIKTRSRLGGMELAGRFPELVGNEKKDYAGAFYGLLRNPLKWPGVAVYLYVNLMSRRLARQRFRSMAQYRWEKDMSARQAVD